MPFLVGQTVGDYVVVRAADQDAAAEVYIVEHTITRRREAMWILGREGHCAAGDAERLFTEIRFHASLSHPNIVGVHNAFWAGDALVMICELVEGGSLRTALESGPLPLNRSLDIMAGVLSALVYAHANGVRPCALSPARIFLARDGNVKLLNFGLASPGGPLAGAQASCGPNAEVEQDYGGNEQDDLYLCGVLFHELVTGSKPVSPRLFPNFLETRCEESVLRWASANRKLAMELKDTIGQAIAAEPALRFQSASDFLDAIQRMRQGSRVPTHRPRLNHPKIVIGLVAVGSACALIVTASSLTSIGIAPHAEKAPRPIQPEVTRLAAPVSVPVQAQPAVPAGSKQPLARSRASSAPPVETPPTPPKKNPIIRLAGAFKRINPVGRNGRRQAEQTETTASAPHAPNTAKSPLRQTAQKQSASQSYR